MRAADLKRGDRVQIRGVAGEVTHARKSRRYPGFMEVHVVNPSSPAGVSAFDVRCGEEVETA